MSPQWAEYWDDRARQRGRAAVAHAGISHARYAAVTERLRKTLGACLRERLDTQDRTALDYGCGHGRFTDLLTERDLQTTAADISGEMLKLASSHLAESTRLVHIADCDLPIDTGAVDVLLTCTVLQHVPDAEFAAVVDELRRVTHPGSLVIVFENIERRNGRTSRSGHTVYRDPREYCDAFPGIRAQGRARLDGELHGMFAGRRLPPAT